MTQIRKKQGFTLIELLIATVIFALVMMITLATFSMAANYQIKLREIRNVSGDGKAIMSDIVKEIRLANGSRMFAGNEVAELSLVNCIASGSNINCSDIKGYSLNTKEPDQKDPYNHPTCKGAECWNGLYILNEDSGYSIIYYSSQLSGSENFLTKKAVLAFGHDLAAINSSSFSSINNNGISVKVDFSGRTTGKTGRSFQPWISVEVNSRSKGWSDLEPNSRFDFQFESVAETRDYNFN